MKRVDPPGGYLPPLDAELHGERVDLKHLATLICDRYYEVFPDEHGRYGPAGVEWCRHDNQWLLAWAIGDLMGYTDLNGEALWLAGVLYHRDFPVDRLVRNLEIAADIAASTIPQEAEEVAARLRQAACAVADAIRDGRLAHKSGNPLRS